MAIENGRVLGRAMLSSTYRTLSSERLTFLPVASLLLWLLFLATLGRYDDTYPERCAEGQRCPRDKHGFREVVVRPEVRLAALGVFAAEAALGVLTGLVQTNWRTGGASRGVALFTVLSVGRYVPLALALVYDPLGHEPANNTCFATAFLLDFLSFVAAVHETVCDATTLGIGDAPIGYVSIVVKVLVYGVWALCKAEAAREYEWFVLATWALTDAAQYLSLKALYAHLKKSAAEQNPAQPIELNGRVRERVREGGPASDPSP